MSDKTSEPAGLTAAASEPTGIVSSVKVTLLVPLKREGGDITHLTLRKPKAGEMRGLKVGDLFNGEVGSILTLVPRICDPFIGEHEAAELSSEDIAEIAGTVTGFFMTPAQKALIAQMMGTSG